MQQTFGAFQIDDTLERIDFPRVTAWLASTYWSPGIGQDRVERAARNAALAVGAYGASGQIGFLRVISDKTTFGYIADVFVDPAHRGQKLAQAMVRFALTHPEFQNMRQWLLITRDAHPVYAGVGFNPLEKPEMFMIHRPVQATPSSATPL